MTASSIAYSIADLREQARSRLPRAIFDFFDGGAEDEVTLQENLAASRRARLVPRVLRGVANVSTEATLFDRPMALPIAVAPTGAVGYGRPGADLAIARAACAAGIPYTLSTTASASIEQIAKAASGRLWFQAYVLSNKAFLMTLIERARQADYEALMITVDLPVGGKRERDFRNHFSVPFRFTRRNLLDFAQHPRWALELLRQGMPVMENLIGLDTTASSATAGSMAGSASNSMASGTSSSKSGRTIGGTSGASAIASSVGKNYDAGFDWTALQTIRDQWPRKLIVKGVVHPEGPLKTASAG